MAVDLKSVLGFINGNDNDYDEQEDGAADDNDNDNQHDYDNDNNNAHNAGCLGQFKFGYVCFLH